MLFVYGSGKGKAVLGEGVVQPCPACKTEAVINPVVEYSYFHIWWLFSFVTGRKYALACSNCEASAPVDAALIREKYPHDNIPFIRKNGWLVVVIPVMLAIAAGIIGGAIGDMRTKSHAAAPAVNDLYLANLAKVEGSGFETDGNNAKRHQAFGTMKLIEIDGDDLVFATSMSAYDKASALRKALKDEPGDFEYDMDEPVTLTRQSVEKLLSGKVILEIRR